MTTATETAVNATLLAAGFRDPVHEAQGVFRAVMNALARPGTLQAVETGGLVPPAPLPPTAAAIALTLFDYDTPVWLDRPLMASEAVKSFLRFHTGCPIISEPVEAAFALICDPLHMIPLASFNQGSAEYPDRSTTLVLTGQAFGKTTAVTLEGPGIRERQTFATGPVPPVFWDQIAANHRQFPRGVDLVFAGETKIAALPRSTRILTTEV